MNPTDLMPPAMAPLFRTIARSLDERVKSPDFTGNRSLMQAFTHELLSDAARIEERERQAQIATDLAEDTEREHLRREANLAELKSRLALFDDATLRAVVAGQSELLPLDLPVEPASAALAAAILKERGSDLPPPRD